jgi:hypothetical protein
MLGLWYLRCRCIMKIPFIWYQDFLPCDLDLELWPSFEKKALFWTISFEPNVWGLWYLRYRWIMKKPLFWFQDFDLVTLNLNFDLVLKNFNLGYNMLGLRYLRSRCIMKRPFLGTKTFDLVILILTFDLFLKTLIWTVSFELDVFGLWYFRTDIDAIMKRPFFWYQDFWPWS